jgi:2-dehydro-3-deoxyphosphogluconate aldolase/(4S)-4-hydroxy-2-oxoglutarate aldolase
MNIVMEAFKHSGVIPVFYHDDPEVCTQVLRVCYESGLRVFEFTNRGAQAQANFKYLLAYKKEHFPDMQLGIGTIKDAQTAQSFIELGTEFIVSPILDAGTAQVCNAAHIPWIPGCMSPTEIQGALVLGANLIKLFPGNVLGPGFLKAIKPLFPDGRFMPTGGVSTDPENLKEWFDAGVVCVGMGSNLLDPESIRKQDWDALKQKIMQTFAYIRSL